MWPVKSSSKWPIMCRVLEWDVKPYYTFPPTSGWLALLLLLLLSATNGYYWRVGTVVWARPVSLSVDLWVCPLTCGSVRSLERSNLLSVQTKMFHTSPFVGLITGQDQGCERHKNNKVIFRLRSILCCKWSDLLQINAVMFLDGPLIARLHFGGWISKDAKM